MGRGKVVLKRIENKVSRQVTFSKRRGGLLKKARELAVLCDAHVGVVILSSRGKLFEYCSPRTSNSDIFTFDLLSWSELIQRYDAISNAQHQETNHDDDQQMSVEIARLRRECDQLKANIRRQTGEDLASLSTEELDNLQKQLESALDKDELLNQQLDESRRKVIAIVICEVKHPGRWACSKLFWFVQVLGCGESATTDQDQFPRHFLLSAPFFSQKMGRGKVVLKRIENKVSRQVTFSKRRGGLLKKAHELAVLCDAHVGVVILSSRGKLFEYCSPRTSWSELIQRYDAISNAQHQETNHDDDQQMSVEIARLRRECDQLKANIRRQTGEDLASLSTEELDNLQKQLESASDNVRDRKDELLNQQLDESRPKVHILEDHNRRLRQMINEGGHHRAAVEAPLVAAVDMASPVTPFGGFFPEVEFSMSLQLQLRPQQLPSVQDFSLQDHRLRQW
ncbi:hypothetical protein ACQ4PT_049405 [Festuca glaucescens]